MVDRVTEVGLADKVEFGADHAGEEEANVHTARSVKVVEHNDVSDQPPGGSHARGAGKGCEDCHAAAELPWYGPLVQVVLEVCILVD